MSKHFENIVQCALNIIRLQTSSNHFETTNEYNKTIMRYISHIINTKIGKGKMAVFLQFVRKIINLRKIFM